MKVGPRVAQVIDMMSLSHSACIRTFVQNFIEMISVSHQHIMQTKEKGVAYLHFRLGSFTCQCFSLCLESSCFGGLCLLQLSSLCLLKHTNQVIPSVSACVKADREVKENQRKKYYLTAKFEYVMPASLVRIEGSLRTDAICERTLVMVDLPLRLECWPLSDGRWSNDLAKTFVRDRLSIV